MTLNKNGFTLIELLVVVAMIAIIMGAMTTSVAASQERARIQKATTEVRTVAQAILAYENFARGGKYELETLAESEANAGTLGFLLGRGNTDSGDGKLPALLQAALSGGGAMRDPWGTPYHVVIKEGAPIQKQDSISNLAVGYSLPNFYRLTAEERK